MNPTTPNNDPQQPNVPQENFDNQNTTPQQQNDVVETGQQTTPVPPAGDTGGAPLQDLDVTPPTAPVDPDLDQPISFPETETTPDLPEQNNQSTPPVEPADPAMTPPVSTPEPTIDTPAANMPDMTEQSDTPVDRMPETPVEQPHNPPLSPSDTQGTPMPDENIDEKIRQNGDGATIPQPQAEPEKKGNWFTRLFGGK